MGDTYKENILSRLKDRGIYQKLISKSSLNNGIDGEVKDTIHKAVEFAYNRAKLIIKHMPEYTLHDEEHLFKVLQLMEKLIPEELLDNLNIPELMLLVLSAFFHDLGMAPSQQDVNAWRGNFEKSNASKEQLDKYRRFEQFKSSYPERNNKILELRRLGKCKEAEVLEEILLVDFIRINHASNIRTIVAVEYNSEIKYKTTDLRAVLVNICESHCMPVKKLLELDSSYSCGDGIYVCTPFIAILLRLADVLDFDTDRTPEVLFHTINVNNPNSMEEWKKHFSIQNWDISGNQIIFHSTCEHPQIEYAVRTFCDTIDNELDGCRGVLSNIKDHIRHDELKKYNIQLPLNVDRSKIAAKRDLLTNKPIYRYKNIRFILNKESIIKLLMGSSLYGNAIVALRELLQNSIDTCLLRKAICEKKRQAYTPAVSVKLDIAKKQLIVSDNGMGMNEDDINKYYSNIGTSFYKSKEFYEIKAENEIKFTSISRFGIGILSCFMVSDTVNLETLKFMDSYATDIPIKVVIEGYDSIFYITDGNQKEPGTSTMLELKQDNPWLCLRKEQFFKIVKDTLRYPPFDVSLYYNEDYCCYNKEEILSMDPNDVLLQMGESWGQFHGGTRIFNIKIDDEDLGFKGNANLLLLEKDGVPAANVDFIPKSVDIEGKHFEIQNKLRYEIGKIINNSGNISVNQNGELFLNSYGSASCESKSSFSIHGIEYPNSLFPVYNSSKGGKLRWPIPMLLVLNYGNTKDLDLNSARDEIIQNDKWDEFEQNLSYIICTKIYELTSKEYWNVLYEVLSIIKKGYYNENFYTGLEKAKKEILVSLQKESPHQTNDTD
jgi:hypothetical protein